MIISGNASEDVYTDILQTVTYTNVVDEPCAQQRELTVQAWDAVTASLPLNLSLVVVLTNDYCPVVTSNATSIVFMEGSLTSLLVRRMVVFDITDQDCPPHNAIDSLEIILNGQRDGALEYLMVVPPQGINVTTSESPSLNGSPARQHVLTLTGTQSLAAYLAALGTLTYTNLAEEPTMGLREIIISPFQRDIENCVSLSLDLDVIPVNNNSPLLTVFSDSVVYIEGSGPQRVVEQSGFSLTDVDMFPMEMAEVVLSGIVDTGAEMLGYDSNLTPQGVAVSRTTMG